MMKMKQGIQLYTLRDQIQTAEDTDKTFAALADFGCRVIQISGIGPIPPLEVQQLVEKYGFDVCITHKPFERMLDDLDALVEEHKMIHCSNIGLGSMPGEYRDTPEKVLEFAHLMQSIGEKMQKKGMQLAYHNHDFEFQKFPDGQRIIDILLENTDPQTVNLIPDVAWIQYAGEDICSFLRSVRDRVQVVHMKDYVVTDGKRKFIEFGKGLVDFPKVYQTCAELGFAYAVYEQDCDWAESPMESCRYSFRKMLEMAAATD